MRNLIIFLSAVLCVGIGGGQQSAKTLAKTTTACVPCNAPDGKCIYSEECLTSGISSSKSGRIDRLSDAEYNQRQKLIQALADFDVKTAKAHGVNTDSCPYPDENPISAIAYVCNLPNQDSYEYRGQFLLINVPESR